MRKVLALLMVLPLISCGTGITGQSGTLHASVTAGQYQNPLPIALPDGSNMESCPDPSVIQSQTPGDNAWYMYCTNDLFHDSTALHHMAIAKSTDMIHWKYVGDVFDKVPGFLPQNVGMWAPDIRYFNDKYYLYYSTSYTNGGGPAIFVAVADSPAGPFKPVEAPVVPPEMMPDGKWRDTIDSTVIQEGDKHYILYGSFHGGVVARELTSDGLTSIPGSQTQIAQSHRYEGAYVVKRENYFYLFVSAGPCCDGLASGYGLFVGRSEHALGPYVDRDGNSLLDPRVGGTPVLQMNGNRWLGPGHNAIFTDAAGQDWMLYHAVDVNKPYLIGGWTRRPALMDPVQWVNGWPLVRNGAGPSDSAQLGPATSDEPLAGQPGPVPMDRPGTLLPKYSDDFHGSKGANWKWIRAAQKGVGIGEGGLNFASQPGDMYETRHDASLLAENAPSGDYVVEAKVSNNVPLTGWHNYVQGGLMIYGSDNDFIKLATVAIDDTRQIEFARQFSQTGSLPRYGSSYLAAPGQETWLRLVKHTQQDGSEVYTAYSSHDGSNWERGPSWTHRLGNRAKIALVSYGGTGFVNTFSYVHVHEVAK